MGASTGVFLITLSSFVGAFTGEAGPASAWDGCACFRSYTSMYALLEIASCMKHTSNQRNNRKLYLSCITKSPNLTHVHTNVIEHIRHTPKHEPGKHTRTHTSHACQIMHQANTDYVIHQGCCKPIHAHSKHAKAACHTKLVIDTVPPHPPWPAHTS